MFKALAPNSAHHAIHVNCVLIGLYLQLSSPTKPATRMGAKVSERGTKKCVGNIARLHRFRFCSADITPTVYWLDYRQVNFVSLFKKREEVNWLNYWKCSTVKLSENQSKYGTCSTLKCSSTAHTLWNNSSCSFICNTELYMFVSWESFKGEVQ